MADSSRLGEAEHTGTSLEEADMHRPAEEVDNRSRAAVAWHIGWEHSFVPARSMCRLAAVSEHRHMT